MFEYLENKYEDKTIEEAIKLIVNSAITKASDYDTNLVKSSMEDLLESSLKENFNPYIVNLPKFKDTSNCTVFQYDIKNLVNFLQKIIIEQLALQGLVNDKKIIPLASITGEPVPGVINLELNLEGAKICPQIKVELLPYVKYMRIKDIE